MDPREIDRVDVDWPDARRIIRSIYPPIDLFEDIADPADWRCSSPPNRRPTPG